MKLTKDAIAALKLPRGKSEAIYFDDDLGGFGLRIRRGGSAKWVFQYKIGVQNRRLTLGSASVVSAGQARKTASELHAAVRLGRDPAAERNEGRARAAETMGAALATYLPYQQGRLKPGSYDEVARHLNKHCKPLHSLQLAKIDRRAVAARVAAVAAQSGDVAANRVRASLAAFFAWCMREGLVEQNPVIGTGRRAERSRDRVLSLSELVTIWNAVDDDDDFGRIIKLLILAGQRANEIGALRWSEVQNDRIVLPAARTKNARQHEIPLAAPALAILNCRPRGEFVFGRDIGRPFGGWSKAKSRLDARIREKTGEALPHWVVHDLRRSVATHVAEMGVQPHVIEAVLNHVSGHKHGVAGIYNRATYEREKRQALDMWAERLLSVVEGRESKVVTLRGAS